MNALVVTLAYRLLGQALISQMKAAQAYSKPLDWITVYGKAKHPLGTHPFQIVSDKYAEAQETFLSGQWDTFIAIEDDMIIPENSFSHIEKALAEDKSIDVLYGVYVLRNQTDRYALSAYTRVDEKNGDSIVFEHENLAKEAMRLGLRVETKGIGMGFTAIRRHVLEKIPFERREAHCNDWYFAVDCQKLGFKQVSDFGLLAGHMSLDPSPRILWPDANKIARIEYL